MFVHSVNKMCEIGSYVREVYYLSIKKLVVEEFNVYGSVHRKYIPIYIQQDAKLHYLYLVTALRVSGSTSTHYHGRIQLYLQHLVFVTPLLLSAAIVEELELV